MQKERHFKFSWVNYMEMGQLHNKNNNNNKKKKNFLYRVVIQIVCDECTWPLLDQTSSSLVWAPKDVKAWAVMDQELL